MKTSHRVAYLRSDQALDIKTLLVYLTEVLGRKVKAQMVHHALIHFLVQEEEGPLLENFLATYLQEHHQRLHVLMTYRVHPLGEAASSIGLQKNQGKVDDLSDVVLQLLMENRWDLLPLIQEEFKKVPRHLMLTAMMLLTCDMNASKASEKLYIHRNTFTYRLQKFIALTGLDIRQHRHALFLTLVNKLLMYKR
jgi:hypothetical protein